MSVKIKYTLLALLLLVTITGTTYFFNFTMAVLVTFVLAYLSKGSRVQSKKPTKN